MLTSQGSDSKQYKPALDQIKDLIKTSTSSMTAVPKPLKFLRPHYDAFEKAHASWPAGEDKVRSPSTAMLEMTDQRSNPLPT